MREQAMSARQLERAQESLYSFEHWAAWLMAVVAIVAGVLGILTGFDVIDLRGEEAAVQIPGLAAGQGPASVFQDDFWDGAMLIFAGITAGVLAFTLHSSDHHRLQELSAVRESERSLWTFEHSLAYVMALGSVALVIIGLLTGYQTFSNDNDQRDGMLWIWTGFGASILTMTLHMVRHHQVAAEESYIRSLVEERVGRAAPAPPPTPAREPGTERMR